jgi:hypothetical protein
LVGLRLQSLLGPGSRHCYGIITLIEDRVPMSMSVIACLHHLITREVPIGFSPLAILLRSTLFAPVFARPL